MRDHCQRVPRRVLAILLAASVALVLGGLGWSAMALERDEDAPSFPARERPLDVSQGFELALQDDQLPVGDPLRVRWGIGRVAQATELTRLDLIWKFVEPERGRYQTAGYERMLEMFADRGVRVLLDVHTAPEWAVTPEGIDIDAYAAMLQRVLCRPAASRAIVALEPWNEPNIAFFLRPQWRRAAGAWQPASPGIYADLVRAADRARQACRPRLPLVGPALAATGSAPGRGGVGVLDFLQELPRDLPLDALSQHLYLAASPAQSRALPSYRRLDEVIAAADRRFGRELPVIISETGFLTARTPYHSTVVAPDEQAQRLREAVSLAAAHPRVRALVYFNLEDNPNWPAGLFRLRGAPKPAWRTFLALARHHDGGDDTPSAGVTPTAVGPRTESG